MTTRATELRTRREAQWPRILAIGCSTGGPDALGRLLPALPADFPAPIVVVQHMPPEFTRILADRLDAQCALSVTEATHGIRLEPGRVLLAPGDHHLSIMADPRADWRARLDQGPPEHSCRPAVDRLFRSVAAVAGPHGVGLVLTGMGRDGLRGAAAIRDSGGVILAQDEPTSVVWGMPGLVARAGIAETILPLEEIAHELCRRFPSRRAVA